MTEKRYKIFLDGKKIGTTDLEKADAPMGVAFGNITFDKPLSGYDFLKNYCLTNNIEIISDFSDDKFIATAHIPNLYVFNPNKAKILGQGTHIDGIDNETFQITILGIPYPFFEEEFPHHVKSL